MKLIKKHTRLLTLLFLLITALNFINLTYKNRGLYTEDFNPENHKKLYGGSQYVNKIPSAEIGDEIVYAFAAWENINGANPILINGEQPPLGKYFIGLSELYFDNSRLTAPLFNALSLIALFWLLYLVLDSSLLSSALVTLFSFEKVFVVQMYYAPNLDNIQLFFALVAFSFFVKWLRNSGSNFSLFASLLSLGCVASTKFWITAFLIYIVWLLSLLLAKNKKKIIQFVLCSPIILIPMLLSYTAAFAKGMTVREFFGVQKFIYVWHKAKLEFNPVAVWDFLMLGRWHFQDEIRKAVDWQFTWPILGVLSILAIYLLVYPVRNLLSNGVKQFKKSGTRGPEQSRRAKNPIYIIGVWFVVYFAMLSVSSVNGRYLLPILPAMYILSGWVIKQKLLR